MVVALEVTDDATYDRYRDGMRPILSEYEGRFDWDVRGGEVLVSPDANAVNRVFAISFPDHGRRVAFFADPRYLAVRAEFFERSVAQVHIVAET